MPFALNDATRFINPTKTLEYLATGKPVVSTPIADVVRNFGDVVQVADGPQAFIESTKVVLEAPDAALRQRGLERAAANSWETTVASMRDELLEVLS
jgi:glycosyltransferase involved in cell wall biosynthesis